MSVKNDHNISFKVMCPYCGKKLSQEKTVHLTDYADDLGNIVSDFEMEEFHCPCGETFLGAETVQCEKVEKVVTLLKELQEEGKFHISEREVKISLGFSDIWRLIKEMKDIKGDFI